MTRGKWLKREQQTLYYEGRNYVLGPEVESISFEFGPDDDGMTTATVHFRDAFAFRFEELIDRGFLVVAEEGVGYDPLR